MRIISILILLFFASGISGQNLKDFELVEKYKIDKLKVKVYFKDPLVQLIKKYPDFDNKKDKEKHNLLSDYLHNNTLYIFQTYKKKELQKSYILKGNPKEIRTKYYFDIEVFNAKNIIEKTIDKINIGGSFFEHMFLFQTPQGKSAIGKGIKMWGYFVMIQPFINVQKEVSEVIELDINNAIPNKILSKKEIIIETLFDYQKIGLKTIVKRDFTITVFQYDSLGQVKNKYPRTEVDTELYLSSISDDLTGVTTFPFFSVNDKKEIKGNKIHVTSELENINHYLEDIIITTVSEEIVRIEGKLKIHGYTINGKTLHYELYIAEFKKVGECTLPNKIKFCPLEDIEHKKPRLVIEIKYELK